MSHGEKYYRTEVKDRAIFYGFIELENIRSLRVSETFQFSSLGRFQTLFFSRFFPRKNQFVQRISEEDKPQYLELLDSQYRDYALVNFRRIFFKDNTYIYKKGGEILAGAQVNTVRWIFENIPGFTGWLNMHVVPRLPVLGRLSKPDSYNFTSFEGLVCQPGQEAALIALFEHILASHGHYTGMTWLDTRSPLLSGLKDHGKLGLLFRVQKSLPAGIVAAFVNVPPKEQEAIKAKPVYISAFDLT
jgi:hypothetical protein